MLEIARNLARYYAKHQGTLHLCNAQSHEALTGSPTEKELCHVFLSMIKQSKTNKWLMVFFRYVICPWTSHHDVSSMLRVINMHRPLIVTFNRITKSDEDLNTQTITTTTAKATITLISKSSSIFTICDVFSSCCLSNPPSCHSYSSSSLAPSSACRSSPSCLPT